MRDMILCALVKYYRGEIAKYKANVEIYLESCVGVGEHSDIIETIDDLITKISKYEDNLQVLQIHYEMGED